MPKEKAYLFIVITFYIIQRLSELWLNKSNENFLKENFNAVEVNPIDSLRMKLFHSIWFFSLIAEVIIHGKFQPVEVTALIFFVLGLCLIIRYHTINTLKEFWTIKVYKLDQQPIIKNGLYQYVRHPNYLAVIIELIAIPLLLNAYYTMIIFGLANLIILKYRIELEESNLSQAKEFNREYRPLKRFIPYLF